MHGNYNMSMSAMEDDAACSRSFMCCAKQSPQKSIHEERAQEKKNKGSSQLSIKEDLKSQNMMNKKAHVLEQKMKAMDMMNAGDLEHVLVKGDFNYKEALTKSLIFLEAQRSMRHNVQGNTVLIQGSSLQNGALKRRLSNNIKTKKSVKMITSDTPGTEIAAETATTMRSRLQVKEA
ncbi:hypothetical protein D0Y65_041523 [Glycine soja]|uniref:Uncharacterized protein n=1 Tax=Glycine soja TaxID=3848 RepID=A0A445GW10_GLYSO|nr:hypothetical protein D0Y65_041523 [Glycine soja]